MNSITGDEALYWAKKYFEERLAECFYKTKDTFAATSTVLNGFVTTSATKVYLSMYLPKSMKNVTEVEVTRLYGNMRGVAGYLDGSSNIEFTEGSYSTVATIRDGNMIRIAITKNAAFDNATNNTVVSFSGTVNLKFT